MSEQKIKLGDPPTKRQQRVVDFVKKFTAEKGYPPTIRDICKGLKISSPNGVNGHLRALEKRGVIARERWISRSIRVIEGN